MQNTKRDANPRTSLREARERIKDSGVMTPTQISPKPRTRTNDGVFDNKGAGSLSKKRKS